MCSARYDNDSKASIYFSIQILPYTFFCNGHATICYVSSHDLIAVDNRGNGVEKDHCFVPKGMTAAVKPTSFFHLHFQLLFEY